MPNEVLNQIHQWLNSLFGANFIQPLLLMSLALYAMHKGMMNAMTWAEKKVLEPYFRPFRNSLDSAISVQSRHTDVLTNHEARLHDTELDVAILQGKVMGGRPTLEETTG